MAIYIDITRTKVTPDSAEYTYRTVDNREGKSRIHRLSGETELIEPAPDDIEHRLYQRAAFQIKRALNEEVLPESAVWAS